MENLLESVEFKWAMIGLVASMALFILSVSIKFAINSIIYLINFLLTTKANISIPFYIIYFCGGMFLTLSALVSAVILSMNDNNMADAFLGFSGVAGVFTLLLAMVLYLNAAPKC